MSDHLRSEWPRTNEQPSTTYLYTWTRLILLLWLWDIVWNQLWWSLQKYSYCSGLLWVSPVFCAFIQTLRLSFYSFVIHDIVKFIAMSLALNYFWYNNCFHNIFFQSINFFLHCLKFLTIKVFFMFRYVFLYNIRGQLWMELFSGFCLRMFVIDIIYQK